MNNLIKLYITCACFSIQNYNFQTKSPFYFWKSFQLSTSKNKNKNFQPPKGEQKLSTSKNENKNLQPLSFK
jgi:hypothetical protein